MAEAQGDLYVGVDGGGSATRAVLTDDAGRVLGRGRVDKGSNPKALGFEAATANVATACRLAFADAGIAVRPATRACLALAGAGRPEDRPRLENWVVESRLAVNGGAVADAVAVLAAASPQVVGVALISGTGSMAFGRDATGRTARAGGWGYLLGDEGSGYRLALAGLRAVCQAADGRGPATALTEAVLEALQLQRPEQLVAMVYSAEWDRRRIALLAAVVAETAQHDDVARGLLHRAADELANAVVAVVGKLQFEEPPVLAVTGGLLLGSAPLREFLHARLQGRCRALELVHEPALGAAFLARTPVANL